VEDDWTDEGFATRLRHALSWHNRNTTAAALIAARNTQRKELLVEATAEGDDLLVMEVTATAGCGRSCLAA
jgi:hypothetical protein